MPLAFLPDLRLNYRDEGTGAPVVFSHALGLDLTMWDAVLPLLPPGLRLIRYDHRGHGGSDVPAPPYTMGALVRDAEHLLDHLGVKDCVFVGLSMGGLVAQGLAVKRLYLVRGMVLSNTAARIGIESQWQARAQSVSDQGMEAVADTTMERWFSRRFRAEGHHLPWRERLLACAPEGYIGACAAIGGTDFYTPTASLTLPTLTLAGSEDGSTPPDLVRETAELIAGAEFRLLRGSGHLPPVDAPEAFSEALSGFLRRIGHV
jgi:3-oxoadipate enol-lactonase